MYLLCVCAKTGDSVTCPMCSGSSQGRTYKSINQPQHDKNRCCQPLLYGKTLCRRRAAGVCNRDEGSMVELAEILMRPRGSAIVTRVPWFDGREVQNSRLLCLNGPGIFRLGCSPSRQKAVLFTPKRGDGQPEKPRCDIPPGPGARKGYAA